MLVHETPGPHATPRIVEYHAATTLKSTSDETPWCAAFVNWCFKQAGVRATGSARALSFAPWGVFLREPRLGCVAVIEHPGGRGHVGFVVGRAKASEHYYLLGGNQGNAVTIKRCPAVEIIGYRWPRGVPVPESTILPELEGASGLGGVAETR
jgi:uncharacterized protein (TIGR02594 family)